MGAKKDGTFLPGSVPNPHGRHKGSKHKLGEEFVAALQQDFHEHGMETIEKVREERPEAYLKVIAQIIPKDIHVQTSAVEDLSTEELDAMILALRDQLSEAVDEDLGDQPASSDDAVH